MDIEDNGRRKWRYGRASRLELEHQGRALRSQHAYSFTHVYIYSNNHKHTRNERASGPPDLARPPRAAERAAIVAHDLDDMPGGRRSGRNIPARYRPERYVRPQPCNTRYLSVAGEESQVPRLRRHSDDGGWHNHSG